MVATTIQGGRGGGAGRRGRKDRGPHDKIQLLVLCLCKKKFDMNEQEAATLMTLKAQKYMFTIL